MSIHRTSPPPSVPIGIVLLHGYLGDPSDLEPLESALTARHGEDAVENIRLPGHGNGHSPAFDETAFLAALSAAMDRQLAKNRRLVLLGHSTGGSLILAELARRQAIDPQKLAAIQLVVLCATPPFIDLGYARRWANHTANRQIALHDVGELVSFVNRLARRAKTPIAAPALVLHGEDDELVPVDAADSWRRSRQLSTQRHVRVAGARHHLFCGDGAEIAIDEIVRAVDDACRRYPADCADSGHRGLFDAVPGLLGFRSRRPDSFRHVMDSPAACRAVERDFRLDSEACAEPTIANIEITTRCNLGCRACARTRLKPKSQFMSREDFLRVLSRLPHAYRVVLVGLGEPLMHPDAIDFVKLAVAEGRRVGLVTNGMLMDSEMAHALCESGLSSVTFSIDAVGQTVADTVRKGSDMSQISANIRTLQAARKRLDIPLETSVFTALSSETVGELEAVIDFAADHGFDAMMVSDLNFQSNRHWSVREGFSSEQTRAFRKALKKAVARRLPVLSVRGLEEFALHRRYLDFLLLRGEQLAHRPQRHRHCVSPWQSIPVTVDGNLTLCDCQPETVIGNIHRNPVTSWWNGETMKEHRQRMLSEDPPEACRLCPRF